MATPVSDARERFAALLAGVPVTQPPVRLGPGSARLAGVQRTIDDHFARWFVLTFGAAVEVAWPGVARRVIRDMYAAPFMAHQGLNVCPTHRELAQVYGLTVHVNVYDCVGDS